MGKLLLLFIVVPAVELALLIEIGSRIGTAATLAIIVVTGIVGASLARRQGLRVILDVQREIEAGSLPTGSILDGVLIAIASALLITPGVLTDVFGFLCLSPGFRSLLKGEIRRRFERAVAEDRIHVDMSVSGFPPGFGPVRPAPGSPIDVTPTHADSPEERRARGGAESNPSGARNEHTLPGADQTDRRDQERGD
jgi:UPF0716 protein FxsA